MSKYPFRIVKCPTKDYDYLVISTSTKEHILDHSYFLADVLSTLDPVDRSKKILFDMLMCEDKDGRWAEAIFNKDGKYWFEFVAIHDDKDISKDIKEICDEVV